MGRLRQLSMAVMTISAIVVACSDQSPTEVLLTDQDGAGAPAACNEWSCNAYICGHPTEAPYHACCVRTIYDSPGSEEDPLPTTPEPNCSLGGGGGEMPQECERGMCQSDGDFWPAEEAYQCVLNGSGYCPSYCSGYTNSCTGQAAACAAESPPTCYLAD